MAYICTGHEADIAGADRANAFSVEAWCETCEAIKIFVEPDTIKGLNAEVEVTRE